MDQVTMIGIVVVGLSAIISLGVAVVKPITNAVKAITELTISVQTLTEKMSTMETDSHAAHKRLWDKNEEQDKILNEHDVRITVLENK